MHRSRMATRVGRCSMNTETSSGCRKALMKQHKASVLRSPRNSSGSVMGKPDWNPNPTRSLPPIKKAGPTRFGEASAFLDSGKVELPKKVRALGVGPAEGVE